MKKLLLLVVLLGLFIAGCGSGGVVGGATAGAQTNGSLALSDLAITAGATGNYNIDTKATYTPPTGKVSNGLQINISAAFTDANNKLTVPVYTQKFTLGTDGIATFSYSVKPSSTAQDVLITATTGDLVAVKRGIIPAAVTTP